VSLQRQSPSLCCRYRIEIWFQIASNVGGREEEEEEEEEIIKARMHGRPRQRAAGETSEAENDKELAKVAELQELIPSILHNHRTCWY